MISVSREDGRTDRCHDGVRQQGLERNAHGCSGPIEMRFDVRVREFELEFESEA
jgi:hypothetical protein